MVVSQLSQIQEQSEKDQSRLGTQKEEIDFLKLEKDKILREKAMLKK